MKYMVLLWRDVRQTKQIEIDIADDSRLRQAADQLARMAPTMPDYADGWGDDDVVDSGVDSIGPGYL